MTSTRALKEGHHQFKIVHLLFTLLAYSKVADIYPINFRVKDHSIIC